MKGVRITEHFGIVIRKAALQKQGVSLEALLQVMKPEHPFDEDEDLISFHPHFGGEVVGGYIRSLEALGLVYEDDFIDFSDMLPEWCQVYIVLKPEGSED